MAGASRGVAVAARPRSSRRRALTGFLFFAPFLVVFLAAIVAPLLYALYLSLFRHRLIGGTTFVGLDNYFRAATDPQFLAGLARVALILAMQVPVMLLLALFVALAIDSKRLWWPKVFRLGVFVHNWSWDTVDLPLPTPAQDVLTGDDLSQGSSLQLGPWDVRVLREQAGALLLRPRTPSGPTRPVDGVREPDSGA